MAARGHAHALSVLAKKNDDERTFTQGVRQIWYIPTVVAAEPVAVPHKLYESIRSQPFTQGLRQIWYIPTVVAAEKVANSSICPLIFTFFTR